MALVRLELEPVTGETAAERSAAKADPAALITFPVCALLETMVAMIARPMIPVAMVIMSAKIRFDTSASGDGFDRGLKLSEEAAAALFVVFRYHQNNND